MAIHVRNVFADKPAHGTGISVCWGSAKLGRALFLDSSRTSEYNTFMFGNTSWGNPEDPKQFDTLPTQNRSTIPKAHAPRDPHLDPAIRGVGSTDFWFCRRRGSRRRRRRSRRRTRRGRGRR
eukprot:459841-Pyramimonas_sp.AAC.1